MGRITRTLRWGWRGVELLDILLSIGVLPMIWRIFGGFFNGWESWELALFFGGLFLVILSLLGRFSPLLWGWIERKRKKVEPKVETSHDIVYYPSRNYWTDIPTEWGNISEAWLFCHTGLHIRLNHNLHRSGKIRRLILVDPKCNSKPPLIQQCRTIKREPSDIEQEVRILSKEAHYAKDGKGTPLGVLVKWLDKLPRDIDFYLIANPNTENAWIRVETFIADKHARDWSSYRVEVSKHEKLYKVLVGRFERLWDIAVEPDCGLL